MVTEIIIRTRVGSLVLGGHVAVEFKQRVRLCLISWRFMTVIWSDACEPFCDNSDCEPVCDNSDCEPNYDNSDCEPNCDNSEPNCDNQHDHVCVMAWILVILSDDFEFLCEYPANQTYAVI